MTKIFISYSKARELVEKLAEELKLWFGDGVWFDRELEDKGGQLWWDNILSEIETCDIFI